MVLSLILLRAQLNLFPVHVIFSFSDSISHLWSGDDAPFPSICIYPLCSADRAFGTYSISHHYTARSTGRLFLTGSQIHNYNKKQATEMLLRGAEPCKHIQPSQVNTRNRERAQADIHGQGRREDVLIESYMVKQCQCGRNCHVITQP